MITLNARFLLSALFSLLLSSLLLFLSSPSFHVSLVRFFTSDLPPLDGRIRIFAYTSILSLSLLSFISRPPFGDSPLHAPVLYEFTLPAFFSLEGAMKLVGKRWLSLSVLQALRTLSLISLVCCLLGFGGLLSRVLAALSFLILHGVVAGLIGTSHRWYVPVYTLLALCFANGNASYSLDAYFTEQFPLSYPFAPPSLSESPLLNSGFARKMILIASISTLVFGGITKLLNGGFHWLNGQSLAYYVSSDENGKSILLKHLMHTQPALSLFLSVSSIVLECGSMVAVFSVYWRPIILLNATAFHFGIWLTMWPNYAPQTFCYAIGTRWWIESNEPVDIVSAIGMSAWEQIGSTSLLNLLMTHQRSSWPSYFSSTPFIASCLAFTLCLFLTMIALFRIEYWPLTGIPMYSFYRDHSFSYRFLRDESQAQQVAIEHVQSGYPNALAWSNLWIILRLKNTDPSVAHEIETVRQKRHIARAQGVHSVRGDDENESWYVNLKSRVTAENAKHGVLTKQWRRTLHNIAAIDMAAKPSGHIRAVKDGKVSKIEAESGTSDDDEGEMEALDENETSVEESKMRRRRRKSPPQLQIEAAAVLAYPGERWLLANREALRLYARQCDWKLPVWADKTGELQLRVKLKHGYAVLARCPWLS